LLAAVRRVVQREAEVARPVHRRAVARHLSLIRERGAERRRFRAAGRGERRYTDNRKERRHDGALHFDLLSWCSLRRRAVVWSTTWLLAAQRLDSTHLAQ
jgi:hypothetical protein